MSALTEIGRDASRDSASDRPQRANGGGRGLASPVAVTKRRSKIDERVLDELVDMALVGSAHGCDVGWLSVRSGRCDITQPARREPYLETLSLCSILLSSRVLRPGAERSSDIERGVAIANRFCANGEEAEAFLALAFARVQTLAGNPTFWKAHQAVRERIIDAGGSLDLAFRAPRDTTPLITLEPNIVINMPATVPAVVNVAAPAAEPAVANVNVPPPEDKVVRFERDYSGRIIEATTSGAGAA